jgi:hypothetical protein
MGLSENIDDAQRFDRFTSDVNAIFRRHRKEIKNLQKTKLLDEKVGPDVYVFWFIDETNKKHYII